MTAFASSHLPPIKATGMRGFLKWFQREQPEVYKVIAPKLPAVAPSAFGAYISSRVRATRKMGALANARAKRRTHLMVSGLGQDDTDTSDEYSLNTDLTINPASLTGSGSDTPDISSLADQISVPDVSDTASSTAAGGSTANGNAISSLIAGVTGLFVGQQQLQTAQQITNLQLQRAQAGLSPLNIGMNANGVPTVTGIATSPTTLLLLGGVGLVVLFMMMGGKKSKG